LFIETREAFLRGQGITIGFSASRLQKPVKIKGKLCGAGSMGSGSVLKKPPVSEKKKSFLPRLMINKNHLELLLTAKYQMPY
jgi:hypothetical protein